MMTNIINSSQQYDQVESRWWTWLNAIENSGLQLATSACAMPQHVPVLTDLITC